MQEGNLFHLVRICQEDVTGGDSKFDLKLLSQCGSMENGLSWWVPEIHFVVVLCQATKKTNKPLKCASGYLPVYLCLLCVCVCVKEENRKSCFFYLTYCFSVFFSDDKWCIFVLLSYLLFFCFLFWWYMMYICTLWVFCTHKTSWYICIQKDARWEGRMWGERRKEGWGGGGVDEEKRGALNVVVWSKSHRMNRYRDNVWCIKFDRMIPCASSNACVPFWRGFRQCMFVLCIQSPQSILRRDFSPTAVVVRICVTAQLHWVQSSTSAFTCKLLQSV